ncbi:MAG: DUF2092 domain-containing protein, partial [Specibacter sp.]
LQASAPVSLPARTPAQLLALMAASDVSELSGTLEQSVDLGLPQLPTGGPAPSSTAGMDQLLGLLTSPHTVRIYLDGATNQRVQVLDRLAERDVVRHGNTVWTYDSATNTATQLTLPTPSVPYATAPNVKMPGYMGPDTPPLTPKTPEGYAGSVVPTPAQLAAKFLANLTPSTQVASGPDTKVAGRDAYELVLMPRTSDTLVGNVTIAIDAATGLPLSVSVQAKGSDKAAFAVAFSQLKLAAPPASMFTFTPPPGATVTKATLPVHAVPVKQLPGALPGALPMTPIGPVPPAAPTTSGTGWATIVEAPAGTVPASLLSSPQLAQMLQSVAGGHALTTSLFTALVTTDGHLYVGAVPLSALQAAAAGR